MQEPLSPCVLAFPLWSVGRQPWPKRRPSVPGSEPPLLRSHLIRLKSLLLQDFRFQDLSPDAGLTWPGMGAADLRGGEPVLFQAWNLEASVGVCPHHPPSRRPRQARSPPGSDAPARLQKPPPAAPAFGSVFNGGDGFPQSSDGWPLFLLKCVRRREALHHV